MTTVRMTVAPGQTPAEETDLLARVAAAVADLTGQRVTFELDRSEDVYVEGVVADRMSRCARWSA